MNQLKAETLRLLEAIREANKRLKELNEQRMSDARQDLLYFRHREQGKR